VTLNSHMKKHSLEKPFHCSEEGCKKSFTTKGHLVEHTKMHTGVKPFECNKCKAAFLRPSGLKSHKMKIHNEG